MVVEKFYEETFYSNIKQYIENESIYKPLVIKSETLVSNVFPIIPIKLLKSTNQFTTLSYDETRYDFNIEIEIYSQDKTINGQKVSKKAICHEIAEKIVDYLNENYRVNLTIELDKANIDSSVHRSSIRLTGVLDTKLGKDKLIVYPR